jgi:hypothetical protein
LINRDEMMDFVGGDVKSMFKTLLAEGMGLDVKIANLSPTRTVDFVMVGRTNVFVILPPGDGLMLRAVTVEGNLGTAGIGTGVWDF